MNERSFSGNVFTVCNLSHVRGENIFHRTS